SRPCSVPHPPSSAPRNCSSRSGTKTPTPSPTLSSTPSAGCAANSATRPSSRPSPASATASLTAARDRYQGRIYHIGTGRPHAGTRVLLLVQDLHIRVINTGTGELLRELVLNPDRSYQPAGRPPRWLPLSWPR